MHIYRFRVLMEDIDDFYRDIEISPGETFESLHKAIIEAADLSGKELASFYICDSKWNRKKEVSLIDMRVGDEEENEKAPLIMSKCKLGQFIDDPHQRMIYVYDFLNLYEFYIELSKIAPAEKGVKYPRCVKKVGEIPKTGAHAVRVPTEFEEELVFDESAGSDEESDGSELFSDADVSGGVVDEGGDASESFDDDKF
jgi:hypothetical protein